MAGAIASGSPGLPSESEWVIHLKDLDGRQISELFDGFCSDCLALLKYRLLILADNKAVRESGKVVSSPANPDQQHRKGSVYLKSREKKSDNVSPSPLNGKPQVRDLFHPVSSLRDGNQKSSSTTSDSSSDAEWQRFSKVGRKKNFIHYERIDGQKINVLQGLELHTGVFSAEEQKQVVDSVYNFQKMGQKGQLMARTYSEPKKWMRGKGRVTIQFGCCYNYAVDKDGNPPGIIRDEEVDPLPPIFKQMIRRMVQWHVLPPACVPNSCIVNIYDEGDCIPPHIDHHDFLRPFCTVSFLTESNILFGLSLKVSGPGEFSGPASIPLPVGSVLVLKGNGADVAKHCVPAVPAKRISVTFRRMDESKIPYKYLPDPELLNLKPLVQPSLAKAGVAAAQSRQEPKTNGISHQSKETTTVSCSFVLQNNDFPPLGGSKLGSR